MAWALYPRPAAEPLDVDAIADAHIRWLAANADRLVLDPKGASLAMINDGIAKMLSLKIDKLKLDKGATDDALLQKLQGLMSGEAEPVEEAFDTGLGGES
jgi:hypothetical protein